MLGSLRQPLVVGGDHPPTARRDDLVTVEGKTPELAHRAHMTSSESPLCPARPECLGRVLYQQDAVMVARLDQARHVRRVTEQVDDLHRFRESTPGSCSAVQFFGYKIAIQIPCLRLNVDKDRPRTFVDDRIC